MSVFLVKNDVGEVYLVLVIKMDVISYFCRPAVVLLVEHFLFCVSLHESSEYKNSTDITGKGYK